MNSKVHMLAKRPKVLLVYPNIWSDVFPLSILMLSAVIKAQGGEVEVFSAVHQRRVNSAPNSLVREGVPDGVIEQFGRVVEEFQPDMIAFSIVEDAVPLASLLYDVLGNYEGIVLTGGVFPTFAPVKALAHPRVDAICIGEGENVFVALMARLNKGANLECVPGLWVKRDNGQIIKNPPPKIVDLDNLPSPDYSIISKQTFPGPVPIIAHRGCPYPCTFCNSPAQAKLLDETTKTAYFRKQSMVMLKRDIDVLVQQYPDKLSEQGLYFCSDTLLAWSNKEFDEFVEMYSDYKIPFICHTTAETVSYERVKMLKDLGLRFVNIGVQHGNENFRRDVLRRRMSNRQIIKRLAMAVESGVFVSVDFIVGFPGETLALAQDTLAFSREIRASARNCSIFVPYHGTALREIAEQKGFLAPETLAVWCPGESQLDMPDFPKHEIARFLREFRATHHLVGGVA